MKLTGKAKEEFLVWCASKSISYIDLIGFETYLNALIIEWFDSVGINIIIYPTMFVDIWHCDIFGWTECYFENLTSRQEAIEKAIEKANEIYNDVK